MVDLDKKTLHAKSGNLSAYLHNTDFDVKLMNVMPKQWHWEYNDSSLILFMIGTLHSIHKIANAS